MSGIDDCVLCNELFSSPRAFDLAAARVSPRSGYPPTRGKCRACGEKIAYPDAIAHMSGHWDGPADGAYMMLAASSERHEFWLLARARPGAYLSDIDRMLRRAWLDCHCDHVSMMLVDGVDFNGGLVIGEHDAADDYLRMEDYTVEEILAVSSNTIGDYTYDLLPSRSTFLDIGIVGRCSASGMERPVEAVMKNERVAHDCSGCGREGAGRMICTECSSLAHDRFMCAACARNHRHDGDRCFLPVRNSPRMGRCMYGRSDRRDTTPWPPRHAWGMRVDMYSGGKF